MVESLLVVIHLHSDVLNIVSLDRIICRGQIDSSYEVNVILTKTIYELSSLGLIKTFPSI